MPENNDSIGSSSAINALYVRGHLDAMGTSASPITFRAYEENANAGYWKGIRVLGDSASINMAHCKVQDAEKGIMTPSTISLRNCQITNCSVCGVYLFEDSTCCMMSKL